MEITYKNLFSIILKKWYIFVIITGILLGLGIALGIKDYKNVKYSATQTYIMTTNNTEDTRLDTYLNDCKVFLNTDYFKNIINENFKTSFSTDIKKETNTLTIVVTSDTEKIASDIIKKYGEYLTSNELNPVLKTKNSHINTKDEKESLNIIKINPLSDKVVASKINPSKRKLVLKVGFFGFLGALISFCIVFIPYLYNENKKVKSEN